MSNSDSTVLKFCKKCQCETERHKHGHCKPCTNARSAIWKKGNKERVDATISAWRLKNADRVKATRDAWLEVNRDDQNAKGRANKSANPDREKANYAAWVARNPDKGKARSAAWRASNPDRERANRNAWRKANPEATKIHNQNRRAMKLKNGGVLSKGLPEKLFVLQQGKCACCGLPLGDNYHLDHILPLALGGTNTDDNIQLLRRQCNSQKHAKHPIDFMQSRGFLL